MNKEVKAEALRRIRKALKHVTQVSEDMPDAVLENVYTAAYALDLARKRLEDASVA